MEGTDERAVREPEVVMITGAVIGGAVLLCACTFFFLRRRGSRRG
ncbi:hypothetical protein ACH41E_03320 [Streptomyces sp. NPDC020412]